MPRSQNRDLGTRPETPPVARSGALWLGHPSVWGQGRRTAQSWLALDDGHDGGGVPVGVDEDDLAGVVDGDDVDAFEGDGGAVFALAFAGPCDGGGVAGEEDVVLDEADG